MKLHVKVSVIGINAGELNSRHCISSPAITRLSVPLVCYIYFRYPLHFEIVLSYRSHPWLFSILKLLFSTVTFYP